MTAPAAQRHIRPWGGVFHWLDRPADDADRRLFVHLVLAGQPLPLRMDEMASTLQMGVRDVAKALFALNRQECVSVLSDRCDWSWQAEGLAGLGQDLHSTAQEGQSLVLASGDGLLLACTGLAEAQAEVVAAWRPGDAKGQAWQSQGLRAGPQRFVLWWTQALDIRRQGLLRLLTRLLLAHGEAAPARSAAPRTEAIP
jgi:hypothetical protein